MKRFYLMLMFLIAMGVASCGRGFPELPKDGLGVDTTTAIPTPPIVISATAYAENKVKVLFSTNMNESSAEIIANYTIANSNLVLVRATMSKTNSMVVYLDTSNMSALSNYSLSCSGITDIAGLSVVVDDNTFAGYGSGDTTAPDITITEPSTDELIAKSYLVYGTASDDSGILKVELRVDGDDYVVASNTVNWSYLLDTGPYQEEITHIIYAKATDLKGNSKVSYVKIDIDRTDPTLVVTSAPSSIKIVDLGTSFAVTGWATDNKQFSTIAINISNYNGNFEYGGNWVDGSNWQVDINSTTMRDDSTNYMTVLAKDFAGNIVTSNFTYLLYTKTIYVRTNGSADGDGSYWFPKADLNDAKSRLQAFGIGGTMKMAEGTYPSVCVILDGTSANIKIIGGYDQGFVSRVGYTTIDGNNSTRHFSLGSSAPFTLSLYNLNMINGYTIGSTGGTIYFNAGGGHNLILSNCVISNCKADPGPGNGAALYIGGANTEIYDCIIASNTAVGGGSGGGIYTSGANVTIVNSIISNNDSGTGNGGGAYFTGGNTYLSNNVFANNTAGIAGNSGGAIVIDNSPGIIYGNTIVNNSVLSGYAGAVRISDCSVEFVGNTLINNYIVNGSGGGLFLDDSSSAIISNTIISNSASGSGGGIYIDGTSAPGITNNIIMSNRGGIAGQYGGGIFIGSTGNSTIHNNTVAYNTGYSGAGIYVSSGKLATITSNNIYYNTALQIAGGIGLDMSSGSTIVNWNSISNNFAINGGGMAVNNTSPTINSNTFFTNIVSGNGGAIHLNNSASPTITGGSITYHSSGHGIYRTDGTSTPTISGVSNGWNFPADKNW